MEFITVQESKEVEYVESKENMKRQSSVPEVHTSKRAKSDIESEIRENALFEFCQYDENDETEICADEMVRPLEFSNACSGVYMEKNFFLTASVLGQFNLGFILIKDSENNLFIVDQHAADEKYNYELLLKNSKLTPQMLLVPKRVNLEAVENLNLLDKLEKLEAIGFKFKLENQLVFILAQPHASILRKFSGKPRDQGVN
jgi:DNA mismatch repair ATPase MutL